MHVARQVPVRRTALASLLVLFGCDPGSIEGWSKGSVPGSGPSRTGPRILDGGAGGGGDEDSGGGEPAPEPPPDDPDGPAPDPGSDPPADPSDPCMGLDYLGTCVGDVARWCEDGMLRE